MEYWVSDPYTNFCDLPCPVKKQTKTIATTKKIRLSISENRFSSIRMSGIEFWFNENVLKEVNKIAVLIRWSCELKNQIISRVFLSFRWETPIYHSRNYTIIVHMHSATVFVFYTISFTVHITVSRPVHHTILSKQKQQKNLPIFVTILYPNYNYYYFFYTVLFGVE